MPRCQEYRNKRPILPSLSLSFQFYKAFCKANFPFQTFFPILRPKINVLSFQKIRASIFNAEFPSADFLNSLSTKRNDRPLLHFHSIPLPIPQLLSCLSKPLQFPRPNFSQFYYQFRPKPLKFAFARSSANSPGTFELIVDANTGIQREGYSNRERIKERRERERGNEARFAAVASRQAQSNSNNYQSGAGLPPRGENRLVLQSDQSKPYYTPFLPSFLPS